MGKSRKEYTYALKYKWLTPLYDPILRLALREQTFKKALVEQARIQPGQRVLDLGCGTGTRPRVHPHTTPGMQGVSTVFTPPARCGSAAL